jgi:hypothetical protein
MIAVEAAETWRGPLSAASTTELRRARQVQVLTFEDVLTASISSTTRSTPERSVRRSLVMAPGRKVILR